MLGIHLALPAPSQADVRGLDGGDSRGVLYRIEKQQRSIGKAYKALRSAAKKCRS